MNRREYLLRASEMAVRGTDIWAAKLDEDKVRIIRENREGLSDSRRAAQFGVHPNVIYRARNYYSWKHVC